MGIVVSSSIPVFAFVHHQAVEVRHRLVQLARLKKGIAHVELHLLSLVDRKGHGIGLLVDSQRLPVFLFLEQMVGIQEIGMSRPGAARIVVHKLHDLGRTVGLTEIERADRLIILCIHATLRLGIGGLGTILGKNGERRTVFLILEKQHAFVEKGFRIVVFDMLLC